MIKPSRNTRHMPLAQLHNSFLSSGFLLTLRHMRKNISPNISQQRQAQRLTHTPPPGLTPLSVIWLSCGRGRRCKMGMYSCPLLDQTTLKAFFHCGNNLQKHQCIHKSGFDKKSIPSVQLPQTANFYVLLLHTHHLVSNGKHHRLWSARSHLIICDGW